MNAVPKKSFRRVVAPVGQKVMWMATGKDASRIGAESRWREGIFLGLSGAGQDANDYARARRKCLERGASPLACEGAAMGPQATRPDDQGQHAENTVASRSSVADRASSRRRRRGKEEEFLARDRCTSERALRSGSAVKLRDVKVVLQSPQRVLDQSLTTTNAGNEWKVQCVTTQSDPQRLEESKRRTGEVAPGPDVVMGQSSSSSSGASAGSGEMPATRGTRRTAEDAGLSRLQDLAERRRVQSAEGEMTRLGELSCETSEVA